MLQALSLIAALAATPATACGDVSLAQLVRFDAAGGNGYFVVLNNARITPPTSGTLRLVTMTGHADIPFLSEGTFVVDPSPIRAVGASLLTIGGAPCEANGISTDRVAGDASRIRPATPHFVADGEVADDRPHCLHPYAAVRTLHGAQPASPDSYAQGQVTVRVSVDAGGRVTGTAVTATDDVRLNAFALDAARHSTFAPAIVECSAAPGEELFTVSFLYR